MRRLAMAIQSWQESLLGVSAEAVVDTMDTTASQLQHKLGGTPALQVCGCVCVCVGVWVCGCVCGCVCARVCGWRWMCGWVGVRV